MEITIANKQATAKVTSLLDSSVILEFDDDHGSTIQSCTVKVDRTQLLRALSEKLIKVRAGDTEDFNFELAEKVFNNSGKQKQPELKKNVKIATDNQKLNKEQRYSCQISRSKLNTSGVQTALHCHAVLGRRSRQGSVFG